MATAIVTAHLWKRWGTKAGAALAGALLICAAVQAIEYREEAEVAMAAPTSSAHVLSWVRESTIAPGKTLYVPYYFVPVLHLYRPELDVAGYDVDWSVDRLTTAVRSPDAHPVLLCVEPVCDQVDAALGGSADARTLIAPVHEGYPLYAMTVTSHRGASGATSVSAAGR
jgi:hypothetical protein